MRDEIVQLLKDRSSEIRSLGVEKLGLFGSVARDDANAESDVDILVRFGEGRKSYDNFIALAEMLDQLLGRRVELVTPEGLSPFIGPRILEELRDVPLGA